MFKMLTLCVLGIIFSLVNGAPSKRQFIMCNNFCTETSCPRGYGCIYNGCGRVCEPTAILLGKKDLGDGACVDLCDPTGSKGSTSCQTGYECRSNGCGHTCQPSSNIHQEILNKDCKPVSCDIHCPNGFATGSDGCKICACKPSWLLTLGLVC